MTLSVTRSLRVDPNYGIQVAAACDAPNETRPLLDPEDRTPLGNLDIA